MDDTGHRFLKLVAAPQILPVHVLENVFGWYITIDHAYECDLPLVLEGKQVVPLELDILKISELQNGTLFGSNAIMVAREPGELAPEQHATSLLCGLLQDQD